MNPYRMFVAVAFGLFLGALAFQSYANHRLQKSLPPKVRDDSNTANQIPSSNASMMPQLQTFLGAENANRAAEMSFANFVDIGFYNQTSGTFANPNACLGTAGPGLTMTPGSPCIAYNAGYRSTCGVGNNLGLPITASATPDCPGGNSITFPNNSTCWVAMDENTSGNNAGMANFTRVTGTHYLIDCLDTASPSMPADGQLLMETTTSGGSITLVIDLRNKSPFTPPLNGANPIISSLTCAGGVPCDLIGFKTSGTIDPRGYGAKLDAQVCTDASITNGTNVLTSNCSHFTGKTGELLQIYNPTGGQAALDTTITAVTSDHQVTLQDTYVGTTYTGNGGIVFCNDDAPLTNTFINTQPINSAFTIQLPVTAKMCFGTTVNFNARNVKFMGAAPRVSSGTGPLIIPIFRTLPAKPSVFYVPDSFAAEIGNLAIVGDFLWGHSLSAIETIHDTGVVGSIYPATFPYLHDMSIGNSAINGTPFGGGQPTFNTGIFIAGFGAQNDRGHIERVSFDYLVNGISFCADQSHPNACQAVEWEVHKISMNRVAVGIDMSHGGSSGLVVEGYEGLATGVDFYLGDTAKMAVEDVDTEHDGGRIPFCQNWTASQYYPRNFCVEAADTSLWQQANASGQICQTGASQPGCLVSSAPGTTCTESTCNWTAISAPPSMLAIGLGTATVGVGELNIVDSFYDVNGWAPVYGTPANAIISADGGPFRILMDRVLWYPNQANPATGMTPVIDLTTRGSDQRDMTVRAGGGLGWAASASEPGNSAGIYTHTFSPSALSYTHVDIQRLAGYPHISGGDQGERFENYQVSGAAGDRTLQERNGRMGINGSQTINQLTAPSGTIYNAVCSTAGANTYKYKYTCVDHATETNAFANEVTVPSCCTIGVSGCTVSAGIVGCKGASALNLYRTQAGGASNTETFVASYPPNQVAVPSLGASTIIDSATDASIVGNAAPPAINNTGLAIFNGPQQYPNPIATAVAGLPTCNAGNTGLTGWLVNNATCASWWATPVATASPSATYPVRCDGTNWRCSP